MNDADALALINRIETELAVDRWRLHGVQAWPLVRSRIALAAFDDAVGAGWQRGGRRQRVARRAAAAARSAAALLHPDALRGPGPRRPAQVVIVTDGVATARVDGRAFDVVGDPLRELAAAAGASTSTWYTTYACPQPRSTPGTLVQWRLDRAQALRLPWRAAAPQLDGYERCLELAAAAGAAREALAPQRMARLAARIAVMADVFTAWLRAAAPRLVFVNCYYAPEGAALVLACRRCGALSVDVQHGVQGSLHFAYGRWARVPAAGWELLPDRFWCWSPDEAAAIAAWSDGAAGGRHAPIVGGNPWLELWRDATAPRVAAADRELSPLLRRPGTRSVVVTLQWGLTNATFLLPLLDAIAAAGDAWTWWLRLHPLMRRRASEIERLIATRGLQRQVRLDDASTWALPALLRHADVHLTHSSSTVLEAAASGVASVVAGTDAALHYAELVQAGTAVAITDLAPGTLLPALAAQAARRRGDDAAADAGGAGARAMAELLALAQRRAVPAGERVA